jgi:tetratricopeptide (TPR) repeat protein
MRIISPMRKKCDTLTCLILVFFAVQFAPCSGGYGGQRRIGIGESIPEFSAGEANAPTFVYKHGGGKVLMVVFLSGRQRRSVEAASDIEQIISRLDPNSDRLDIVVAVDDPNTGVIFKNKEKEPVSFIHILRDTEYKLWGKFGIIATPTVIISDTKDTVLWVQAGYGPDFVPVIEARLNQALGIAQGIDPNEAGHVKTVQNTTVEARTNRHVQMAKILQKKGRLESAMTELKKAMVMEPNSVDILFDLGELYCTAGRNQEALDLVEGIKVTNRFEKARVLLITGWAKRQMGELDAAEEILLKATALDPNSIRGFFELGQVYQTKGETKKAMQAYHRALLLVFEEPVIKAVSH